MKLADNFEDFTNFSGGVNWRSNQAMLPADQFRDGLNLTQNDVNKPAKRPGRSLINTTHPVPGTIHSMYRYAKGTNTTLLVGAGTTLYEWPVLNDIAHIKLKTNMSGNDISFVTYQQLCFMADGTNMLKYDNEMSAPASAPTTTTASNAGPMVCAVGWLYRYTYYDSVGGRESVYSPASASTGVVNLKHHVSVTCVASSDPRVDTIKIYRTLDNGSTYYYVTGVANTYTFPFSDERTDAAQIADPTGHPAYNAGGAIAAGNGLGNWGIAKPTVVPTVTVSGAAGTFSAVTGYLYKYTYYNTITGHESEGKVAAARTPPFTNVLNVSIVVTASTDSQVSHIRLYRTIDGGSSEYYRVTSVSNATATLTDDMADATLLEQTLYNYDGNLPPTAGKYICKHKARMFVLDENGVLYWSKLEQPESFPLTYYERLSDGDGSKGMGMLSFGDVLLVWCSNKCWAFWGCENESSSLWSWVPIVEPGDHKGLAAPRSLVFDNGYVYWVAEDRFIYRMTRDFVPERISIAIDNRLENTGRIYLKDVRAVNKGNSKLYFAVSTQTGLTVNDWLLEFNTDTGAWMPYMNKCITALCIFGNPNDDNEMYSGDNNGLIRHEATGTLDDAAGFNLELRSRYSHLGNPGLLKKGYELSGDAQMSGPTDSMVVSVRTRTGFVSTITQAYVTQNIWDNGDSDWIVGADEAEWLSDEPSWYQLRPLAQGIVGRYFAVDWVGTTMTGDCIIEGATLNYSFEVN